MIDDFEYVARFNRVVYSGYEADVGTRTTLWCHYGPTYPVDLCPAGAEPMTLVNGGVVEFRGKRYWADHPTRLMRYPQNKFPTSGVRLLSLLPAFFDEVFVIGWFKGEFGHYYDNAQLTATDHCPEIDAAYVQQLITMKLVKEIPV